MGGDEKCADVGQKERGEVVADGGGGGEDADGHSKVQSGAVMCSM